jgi:hypothetical protein
MVATGMALLVLTCDLMCLQHFEAKACPGEGRDGCRFAPGKCNKPAI